MQNGRAVERCRSSFLPRLTRPRLSSLVESMRRRRRSSTASPIEAQAFRYANVESLAPTAVEQATRTTEPPSLPPLDLPSSIRLSPESLSLAQSQSQHEFWVNSLQGHEYRARSTADDWLAGSRAEVSQALRASEDSSDEFDRDMGIQHVFSVRNLGVFAADEDGSAGAEWNEEYRMVDTIGRVSQVSRRRSNFNLAAQRLRRASVASLGRILPGALNRM